MREKYRVTRKQYRTLMKVLRDDNSNEETKSSRYNMTYSGPLPDMVYFCSEDVRQAHAVVYASLFDRKFIEIDHRNSDGYHTTRVGFPTTDDRDAFNEWHSTYMEKYFAPNHPPSDYPLPLGGAYQHCKIKYLSDYDMTNVWVWLISSCEGKLAYTSGTFYFEEEADAMLFEMKYL